ncbi:zinc finger protein 652-like [Littorina saxatilis]|uniref:zinc finger protein 652-like n=1 Tax=Littorina saxatilis TaxID=31220 RepID=UPI0038B4E24D
MKLSRKCLSNQDKEDPDILLTSGDKPVSCATELSRKCLSNQDKSHSNAEERQQLKRNKKHKKSKKDKTELSVIQTPGPEGSSAKPAGEAVVVSIQEGKEFCNPLQDLEMKRDDFESSVCCTVCYICQEEMESVEEYRTHLGKHEADNLLPEARTDKTRAASEHERRKKRKRAVTYKEDSDILPTSGNKPVSYATEEQGIHGRQNIGSRKVLAEVSFSTNDIKGMYKQELTDVSSPAKMAAADVCSLSNIAGPQGQESCKGNDYIESCATSEGCNSMSVKVKRETQRHESESHHVPTSDNFFKKEIKDMEGQQKTRGSETEDPSISEETRKVKKRKHKEIGPNLQTSVPGSVNDNDDATRQKIQEGTHTKPTKQDKTAHKDAGTNRHAHVSKNIVKTNTNNIELSTKLLTNQDKSHSHAEETQQLKRNEKENKNKRDKTEQSVVQSPVPEGSSAKPETAGEGHFESIQEGRQGFCDPVPAVMHEDSDSCMQCTVCYICQKEMESVDMYRTHLGKVHNKRPFQCLFCKCSFNLRQILQGHVEIACTSDNAIPRTFRCTICPKMYATKYGLKVHLRVEHGIGPQRTFQCFRCNNKYKSSVGLHLHESRCEYGRDEEEIRKVRDTKFCCDFCLKKYTYKCALYRHTRMLHEQHGVYTCICGVTFAYAFNYSRHLNKCSQANQANSDQPNDQACPFAVKLPQLSVRERQ